MRTIKILDSRNYEPHWKIYKRDSARAIIFRGNTLVMVKSEKFGEYKFPGGGIAADESHIDTLLRETKEETGLHILPYTVREYGRTLILRKGENENEIFEQESFYYTCDIDTENSSPPKLDEGYETEYDYKLVYATLDEAISANERLRHIPEIPWVERDLTVLYELRDMVSSESQ